MYDLNVALSNLIVASTWAAARFTAEAAELRTAAADPARRSQYVPPNSPAAVAAEAALLTAAERLDAAAALERDRATVARMGGFRVHQTDLLDPAWMARHREILAAAQEAGRVQYDPDAPPDLNNQSSLINDSDSRKRLPGKIFRPSGLDQSSTLSKPRAGAAPGPQKGGGDRNPMPLARWRRRHADGLRLRLPEPLGEGRQPRAIAGRDRHPDPLERGAGGRARGRPAPARFPPQPLAFATAMTPGFRAAAEAGTPSPRPRPPATRGAGPARRPDRAHEHPGPGAEPGHGLLVGVRARLPSRAARAPPRFAFGLALGGATGLGFRPAPARAPPRLLPELSDPSDRGMMTVPRAVRLNSPIQGPNQVYRGRGEVPGSPAVPGHPDGALDA